MFTDLVDSVALKTRLGGVAYASLISAHDSLFKGIVADVPGATVLKDTGDGFLARFATASDAVQAGLQLQLALSPERWSHEPVSVRVGVHLGEVTELEVEQETGRPKLVGLAADLAARLMGLALPGQILMTRAAFDDARQYLGAALSSDDESDGRKLTWIAHGAFELKGSEDPTEVYEVGIAGISPFTTPPDSDKARRVRAEQDRELSGWRPAAGLSVPGRASFTLDRRLGAGGFGEVWLGRHDRTHELRVFKFCFDRESVLSLRNELATIRCIRKHLGDRNDIARLHDVQLDEPPYFLESDFSEHGSLRDWAETQGGLSQLPLALRLSFFVQVCEAVAAAHSVGVLHRDIKPSNILVRLGSGGEPCPCLADFGISVMTDAKVASRVPMDRIHRADRGHVGRVHGRRSSRRQTRVRAMAAWRGGTRTADAGMKVATVATGGDTNPVPGRRAYRKAGFDVEIPSVWRCRLV
jgi:serine/threonine-protein kinase